MTRPTARAEMVSGTRPLISIFMTRVDAEVWHLDEVRIDPEQMGFMDDADFVEDAYDKIRAHVKEAFYELGYVFDDDEPLSEDMEP